VGGCVRDAELGLPTRELDIEVFGLQPEELLNTLGALFELNVVGRDFPVIKLRGLPIDVSISADADPNSEADPAEAAARRDFTINAIAVDPLTDEVIDPFDGRADLAAKILRHTSPRLAEDPLRVLRAMQLVSRFDLDVAPETVTLCQSIEPEDLPQERVFAEWKKLILQGVHPSRGLAFLRDCGWVRHFPELEALIGCEQDPEWHPEGDVWIHTLHCMDAFAAERIGEEREDLIIGLAVLCHDLGKPPTTAREKGRVTSRHHEPVGETLTRQFLERMTRETSLIDAVVPLVGAHLAPVQLFEAGAGDAAIRRLARRVGRIDRLVRVATADQKGRPPLVVHRFEAGEWLLERARALEVQDSSPRRIVMGRHLIDLGLQPSAEFGRILDACYEAQLDGVFRSLAEGIAYARRIAEQGASE
jgi:tRNA nucleotidyltransferase (CCA-adding enzyme)